MAYNDMTVAMMVTQGQRFITPEAEGGSLETMQSDPMCAIYVPLMQAMIGDMGAYQVKVSALNPVIKQLTIELADEDAVADGLVSHTRGVAQHARELMDDPSALDAAVQAMFEGESLVRLTSATYDAMGGLAQMMSARMEPAHWDALEQINLGGVTLKGVMQEWLRLAASISAKDAERQKLGLQLDDAVSRKQVQELRRRWIRLVKAMDGSIGLSGLDARTRSILLAPLHTASEEAGAARQRRAK